MNALLSVILHSGGVCPREAIAVHCHETHGRALDNIDVALDIHGIRVVDSAIGGLGGCPFAGPGAPGNVATELVVSHLLNKGYRFDSAINLHALKEIGTWIRSVLRNLTPS
ncbi:unnamed protein product [Dicrocoelium dendriticum]|nr:unnamed protein product [Dicrocoelium dendriticum]